MWKRLEAGRLVESSVKGSEAQRTQGLQCGSNGEEQVFVEKRCQPECGYNNEVDSSANDSSRSLLLECTEIVMQ